ncbi:MAG: hypothetical protein HY680_00630 [Chloroflexi bacterium]|nr:hypothetical protein [Chloroflexota bacterium]
MSLEAMASTVQRVRADQAFRDSLAAGDARLSKAFTEEERLALRALAQRLQRGEGLPKHLRRSPRLLVWTVAE